MKVEAIISQLILGDLSLEEKAKNMGITSKELSLAIEEAGRLKSGESVINKTKGELFSCPDCGSENISAEEFSTSGNWRTVECRNASCGTRWVEHFVFSEWEYE
jgi:predicted RNA-binding Zn-ribbon protein involved in translation (DUF1610 family)